MLRKINTYLITHYPAIWRSKIVYILPIIVFLSLLAPLNGIDNEGNLQKNTEKIVNIRQEIRHLEIAQESIIGQNIALKNTIYEIKKISRQLKKLNEENLSAYQYHKETFAKSEIQRLQKLYAQQKQILAQKNIKGVKVYLSNLKKIDSLQDKKFELIQANFQHIRTENITRNIIAYSIFFWILLVVVWLYIQYLSPAYLGKYSFFDISKASLINFTSIFIFLIPIFLLVLLTVTNINDYETNYFMSEIHYYGYGHFKSQSFYVHTILKIAYFFVLPIVFISIFIRQYSFAQIIITVLIAIAYIFCFSFFMMFFLRVHPNTFINALHISYVGILLYSLWRVYRKKHGQFSKILILLVLGAGHLLIGFVGVSFFFPYEQSTIIFEYLYFNDSLDISIWLILYASSFVFLMLLTWYFSRALQQPRVRR